MQIALVYRDFRTSLAVDIIRIFLSRSSNDIDTRLAHEDVLKIIKFILYLAIGQSGHNTESPQGV